MASGGPGRIYVLAGTHGAGKSSIGGAAFRHAGVACFDPDAAARRILVARPDLTRTEATNIALRHGRRLLEAAIVRQLDFAFETSLDGESTAALLERAAKAGLELRIWYVGLATAELHLDRMRQSAAKGGHAIAESDIRGRFEQSRVNLIRLLPKLVELKLYDNSAEGDPEAGKAPSPVLVLHMRNRAIFAPESLASTPPWAKPIVVSAMRLAGTGIELSRQGVPHY